LPFLPLAVVGLGRTLSRDPGEALWILAGVGAFAALAYAMTFEVLLHARLGIADGEVQRHGLFGSADVPVGELARVVEATATFTRWGGIPDRWLFFVDASGRTRLRAYAEFYDVGDLAQLADSLGVPWQQVPGVVSFRELRKQLPGSVPWAWAHYWLSAAGVLVAGFVAAVVVVAIVQAA